MDMATLSIGAELWIQQSGGAIPLSAPTSQSARQLNSDNGLPLWLVGGWVGVEPNHTTAKKHGLLVFPYTYKHVLLIVYLQNSLGFARFRNADYVMQKLN